MSIHPTAVVDPRAEIGPEVTIGPLAVINEDTVIGRGSEIMAHTVVDRYTRIGENCRIFPSAVLGGEPQDLKFGGERTEVVIGDNVTVREFVTIHRGTGHGGGQTSIGSGSYLMAYVHVAHDCKIGRNVILANNLAMSGHVTVEDEATIGGMVAIHQFVRIGAYSYIGGVSRIPKDVPPYMLGAGAVDFKIYGPNIIGLQRKGLSKDTIKALKEAHRIIFRNRRPLREVLEEAEAAYPDVPEVLHLTEFMRTSKRGVER